MIVFRYYAFANRILPKLKSHEFKMVNGQLQLPNCQVVYGQTEIEEDGTRALTISLIFDSEDSETLFVLKYL